MFSCQFALCAGVSLSVNLFGFLSFLRQDRRQHAMTLVSEAERLQQSGSSYPETEVFWTLVCSLRSGLEDFLCRAEVCGRELQTMVNVCDFCEQVRGSMSNFYEQKSVDDLIFVSH